MNVLLSLFTTLKKVILLAFIFGVSIVYAQYYTVPDGYTKVDSTKGTSIYYNKKEEIVVQVVDLDLAKLEHLIIRKSGNEYIFAYPGVFKNTKKAFSVINGAFFSDAKSTAGTISYPFTPGNDVWNDSNYTRTLCIKNNRATVFNNSLSQPSYSGRCDFSITLLHPDVSKSSSASIGRTFIGIIDSKKGSEKRFIAFILKKGSKSEYMKDLAKSWNISIGNLIQGDGSYSTQLISNKVEFYGSVCPFGINVKLKPSCTKRRIPHMIGIYPK